METPESIAEDYLSSLQDLNLNSKPLINMLTILADDNINHADVIVGVIKEHIIKVAPEVKLPILYLIDSIVKNVKLNYVTLFSQEIVEIFCKVFEKVNEKIREKMFALRQTWNDVFPSQKLYALDVKVNCMDANWPITAKITPKAVHVNPNHPNFIHSNPNFRPPPIDPSNAEVAKTISEKQRELLELQKRKLELELEETKQKLLQQEMVNHNAGVMLPGARMAGPGIRGHFPSQYRGPVQRPPNSGQTGHANFSPQNNINKPKITPVNPAMLSNLRQRDPRLARQQQAQSQAPPKPAPTPNIPNLMEVNINESLLRKERSKSIDERSKRTESRSKSVDERQKNRSTSSSSSSRREREKSDRSDRSGSESGSKSSPTRVPRSNSRSKSSHRNREEKTKSPEKKKSSSSSSSKSKSSSSRSDGSGDEKGSPTKFKEVKGSSIKNRNYIRKNMGSEGSFSPKEDVDLRSLEASPEKRLKLSTIPEDEQNGVVKDLVNNNNSVNIAEEDLKKRSLTDVPGENQPSPKRVKNDNKLVDDLFGSSDVDLRAMPAIFDPEDSPLEKDKKPKSFDDVRAKLGKAVKPRSKDPLKKITQIDINEDSQEGKEANMMTILAQAQEMVENEAIGKDQYNNLIQTVIHLNETNKLKEAKRRESLNIVDQDDKYNSQPSSGLIRMRIPKKSKEAVTNDSDERTELKSILSSLDANVTDPKPNRVTEKVVAPTITKRRPSKWSPINPAWEEQNQPPVRQQWIPNQRPPPIQMPPQQPHPMQQIPHMPPQQQPQHFAWEPPMLFNNQNHNQNPVNQVPPMQVIESLPAPCNSVNNPQEDVIRSITIDGSCRETRMYGKTAVVFMEWDKPIELGFKSGMRRIWIDDMEPVCLSFNNDYVPVNIGGTTYPVKFGVPSRELYIGDHWYECFFGGRQIQIPIDGRMHNLRVEGPPPQVNLGNIRQDLVVAKINMIIDAKFVIPIFLDSKPQVFVVDDEKHVIQFADNLKTALIDGDPINVSYGDLPKHMKLGEKKYFVRFGALPKNIIPGNVYVKDMIYINDSPREEPKEEDHLMKEPTVDLTEETPVSVTQEVAAPVTVAPPPVVPPVAPPPVVNVDELLQKLISSGIINNQLTIPKPAEKPKEKEEEPVKEPVKPPIQYNPINFSKPETIKTRQQGIVDRLMFTGMQCSSCGLRYPPEQTIKYSQHLDWHFRQNRRERDLVRKAHSRKWYYDLNDWKQYEEIIDLEENTKNYFEAQEDGNSGDFVDDSSNQRSNLSPPPSCPAGPEDVDRACDVCHERFEQYYNEDLEEWHLKHAIRMDDRFYHPLCYEDYKASLTMDESAIANISADDNAVDVEIKKEKSSPTKDDKLETIEDDDDDDDVIVVPIEEPSITEIPDDDDNDEYVPQVVPKDTSKMEETIDDEESLLHDSMETDVVIQEKTIPFLDLDNFDESAMSPVVYQPVKIKEEPKDEDEVEEDDGFEDVGTVVEGAVDEITIESDSIDFTNANTDSQPATVDTMPLVETAVNMDGNTVAPQSITSVNKIRINITKPKSTTDPAAATSSISGGSSSGTTTGNIDESNSNCNNSNIPVLCSSGVSNIQTIVSLNSNSSNNNICSLSNNINIINNKLNNNSNEPDADTCNSGIDGGVEFLSNHHQSSSSADTAAAPEEEDSSLLFPPPVFKLEMQNVDFKKMPKTQVGLETSGLCSIM